MSEGYLFCVAGPDLYFKLLRRAIETLRQFDTTRAVCVLTYDVDRAKAYCQGLEEKGPIVFTKFELHNHIHGAVSYQNAWHAFGFYPKVFQVMYTPFEKTMFFDVDVVFKTDMTFWWDYFAKKDRQILVSGVCDTNNCSPPDWHWGRIFAVMQRAGLCIPQVSSSFLMYEKSFVRPFLKHINTVLSNLENWGCLPNFCEGYPDEIVYAILLGILEQPADNTMFKWLHDKSKLLCCDKDV